MSTVDSAYAEVQRVTRKRARNFAYGIMLLPREKRRAIAAVYAFARRVDDLADGELEPAEKRARLQALRAALDADPGELSVCTRGRRVAGPRPVALRELRRAPRLLHEGRRRGRRRLCRRVRLR